MLAGLPSSGMISNASMEHVKRKNTYAYIIQICTSRILDMEFLHILRSDLKTPQPATEENMLVCVMMNSENVCYISGGRILAIGCCCHQTSQPHAPIPGSGCGY